MTDTPTSAPVPAADVMPPEGGDPAVAPSEPTGDPELAALVSAATAQPTAAPPATGRDGDPDLASLVAARSASEAQPALETVAASASGRPAEADVTAAAAALPDDAGRRAPRRFRSLTARFAFAFVFGAALVIAVGAGALYAWGLQYDGRILPGVRLDSIDLSGMTPDQASAAIQSAYASLGKGEIDIATPDGSEKISFADIGRGPDTAGLVAAALAAGRQGEPLADLIGGPQAAIHGITLHPAVTYDRAKLAAAVDALATRVDLPAIDASVSVGADGSYSLVEAKDGRAFDRPALLAALDTQLTSVGAPARIALNIPVNPVAPKVTTTAAQTAMAAVQRMGADLVISRDPDSWTIPSAALQPMITLVVGADGSLTPTFDPSGLDPLLTTLAKSVNQTVQDAGLKLVGNKVVVASPSREGRTLDLAGMKAAIVSQMAARQAGTAVEPLPAVVKAVQPKLTTLQATTYAAKMVPISSYSIYYWVLINNHWGGNIEGPATKINGTVIPAGGVFDFWNVVGDLHKIPGVGPGNAIEGGKITITGAFGGGICTTSTTLFNAALEAGMKLGARQNHSEFIDRYPAGLDATVWIVNNVKQTMSFTNDTQYPILIQRVISNAGGGKRWLTFKIWSVPNGRTYKISNRIIKPGKTAIDTIEKDPTHPVGWSYRVNTPVNGAQVWVTVTIYDHGKLHWQKTYYSNYPPINGVLQVGTKGATTTPTPSPSPTASPSPATH